MSKKTTLTILLSVPFLFLTMPTNIVSGRIVIPPPNIDIVLNPVEFIAANNRPTFSWQTSSLQVNSPFFHTLYINDSEDIFNHIILKEYIGAVNNYTLFAEETLLSGDYFWQVLVNNDGWDYGESLIGHFVVEEEPDTDPLILQYEPILYFHPNEDFYPMNIETFVKNSGLWDSHGLEPDELLKQESDINPVSLVDLTPQGQDTANWYLQFSQDFALVHDILDSKPK